LERRAVKAKGLQDNFHLAGTGFYDMPQIFGYQKTVGNAVIHPLKIGQGIPPGVNRGWARLGDNDAGQHGGIHQAFPLFLVAEFFPFMIKAQVPKLPNWPLFSLMQFCPKIIFAGR